MENEVKPSEFGIETKQADEITKGLAITLAEREDLSKEFEETIKTEVTEDTISVFKELRLKISRNRTQGINAWHKTNKEVFLRGGQFVDSIKNRENAINQMMEEALLEKEKHFENVEKERIQKIYEERKTRLEALNFAVIPDNLGDMAPEVWEPFIKGAEDNFKLKKEEEEKAEKERIQKQKEEELHNLRKDALSRFHEVITDEQKELHYGRIAQKDWLSLCTELDKKDSDRRRKIEDQAKENAKLKAEAEAKTKKDIEEKAAREEQKKKEDAEKEAEIKKERETSAKLAAELKEKEEAEKKAEQDEKDRVESELSKGDAEKVGDLLTDLENIKTKYSFDSKKNKAMFCNVHKKINLLIEDIKSKENE